jgi:hypothetical protein
MTGRRYRALLIGNAEYPKDQHNLIPLKGPRNDPVRLREALVGGIGGLFEAHHVRVLAEAERTTIEREIDDILADASSADVVLLYYSGHGIRWADGNLYLCARDTIRDRPRSTALSGKWVADAISSSAVGCAVIILDCCHSGAFKDDGPADIFMGQGYQQASGRGRFVIASCQAAVLTKDADSPEDASPFTAALIEVLRTAARQQNATGAVTISEIYECLCLRLENSREPIPQRRFDGVGDIPFVSLAGKRPAAVEYTDDRPYQELEVIPLEVELSGRHDSPSAQVRVVGRADGAAGCELRVGSPWLRAELRGDFIDLKADATRAGARGNLYVSDKATAQVKVVKIRIGLDETESQTPESPLLGMAELAQMERIRILSVFAELAGLGAFFGAEEFVERIQQVTKGFDPQTAKLCVMGASKSGKSTLVNALLLPGDTICEEDWNRGPMVVTDCPARAAVTTVAYGTEPSVRRRRAEHRERLRFAQYLSWFENFNAYPVADAHGQPPAEFEIGWPSPLCRAGITCVEISGQSQTWPQHIEGMTQHSAARINMIRSDRIYEAGPRFVPAGQKEVGQPTLLVINMIDRSVDERFAGYVWNKYIRWRSQGQAWDGQDLEGYDVFFVDAAKALRGRQLQQHGVVEESGLTSLESRLTELIRDDFVKTRSRYQREVSESSEKVSSWIAAASDGSNNSVAAQASLKALVAELHDGLAAEVPADLGTDPLGGPTSRP